MISAGGCPPEKIKRKKPHMIDPLKQEAKDTRELERIVFFSDAVFAIAITLLVLNIEVPDVPEAAVAQELPARLLGLWPKYLSYVISFVVILSFWVAHHSIFGAIRRYDRNLIWLNSLFLMCVAFLPFPSALFGQYTDQQLVVAIYAGSLGTTRLLLTGVWWYASSGHRLVDSDLDPSVRKGLLIRGLAKPLVFFLSIAISFLSVNAAIYSWVLLIVVDLFALRVLRRPRESGH
jgi:uncharacterized membrane protein